MTEQADGPSERLPLREAGLWVQNLAENTHTAGRPALFLDRDGTVNVDTGFPRSPDELVLLADILPVIRAANGAGMPVIVVTNQSGVGRGLLDWHDFAAVNRRFLQLLSDEDCVVAMVVACAYHEAGRPPFDIADHPMRKPNPGMVVLSADILGIDRARSIVVGDRPSDMEAGRRAGLAAGWMVGEEAANLAGFACRRLHDAADYAALVASIREKSA